jgi:hypothetical protein
MLIVIALIFMAGITFGAGGMHEYQKGVIAREEAARVAAEAQLAKEVAKGLQEAENKMVDMQAAFAAGESKAKIVERTVYVQGQNYVKSTPNFSSPACAIDAAGLSILNRKIATLQRTAAASALGLSVPGPGDDQGTDDVGGGPVPPLPGSDGNVPGVPGQAAESGSAGQVPGAGVSRPPKPKPVN